jgi:hypothetical protein
MQCTCCDSMGTFRHGGVFAMAIADFGQRHCQSAPEQDAYPLQLHLNEYQSLLGSKPAMDFQSRNDTPTVANAKETCMSVFCEDASSHGPSFSHTFYMTLRHIPYYVES